MSTISITHTRPTLMSPSLPLGCEKKFPQDSPSPKESKNIICKTNTKLLSKGNKKLKATTDICYTKVDINKIDLFLQSFKFKNFTNHSTDAFMKLLT